MNRTRNITLLTALFGFSLLSVAWSAADHRVADAAKEDDQEEVRALLKRHADVNMPQPDGATALHWAAQWNDLELADQLIRAGAQVNAANDYGVTPLSIACLNGSPEMAEKLLKAGANPNATMGTGETPLMTAARTGNATVVKLLIANGADVNAREKRFGQTALMWALEKKHTDVAQLLIERKADVRARSFGGFTPLLFAAQQGDLEATKMLLAMGANINDAAPIYGKASARARYSTTDSDKNIMTVAEMNSIKKPPMDQSPKTTVPDARSNLFEEAPEGLNPLLMATASGHESLALFLLEKGADPNAADGYGLTAMHYALFKGMAEISAVPPRLAVVGYVFRPNMVELIRTLIAKGANPNARVTKDPRLPGSTPRFSMTGATPFLLATATGDLDLMRYLIAHGADPLLGTTLNTTPLMVAAGLGNFEDRTPQEEQTSLDAAKMLVDLGADVNAVGESNWTALHGAAYVGSNSIAEFLVKKGANMEVADVFEQTPWSIAEGLPGAKVLDFTKKPFTPHPTTAKLLKQLGATR